MAKYFTFAEYEDGNQACGSDAYFPCDGRWNLNTCKEKAKEYYQKCTPKGKYFAFKVYTGTILNSRPITKTIRIYGN